MSLSQKFLSLFVEVDAKKQAVAAAAPVEAAEPEAAPVLPDAPVDLSQDEDVARARQAGQLLASLPLEDIPLEKARALVARTLQFAGMETGELAGSFQRARELFQAQMQLEQAKIAERRQLNAERLEVLEEAMAEEKAQYQAEVEARSQRIQQAGSGLAEIEKAMAFFVPTDTKGQA